jgi:acyl-CoA thioester hydrolase
VETPPFIEEQKVRYRDLDPYGHVNNAVHLSFFESARVAYLAALSGTRERDVPEGGRLPGVRYVVAENNVRYREPVYLGDRLFCGARIVSVSDRSFTMAYELRAGDSYEGGKTAAEGTTSLVFLDPEKGEPTSRPDWFLPAVAEFEMRSEESLTG